MERSEGREESRQGERRGERESSVGRREGERWGSSRMDPFVATKREKSSQLTTRELEEEEEVGSPLQQQRG